MSYCNTGNSDVRTRMCVSISHGKGKEEEEGGRGGGGAKL